MSAVVFSLPVGVGTFGSWAMFSFCGWSVVVFLCFLLPVGIGTCGSRAVFSFPCWLLVVLLVTTGFGHDRSRYSVFVYFCVLYLSLKHLLRLVHCVRPHSPRISSFCNALRFFSMRMDACWADGQNAASFSWKAMSYMIPWTLRICVSSDSR